MPFFYSLDQFNYEKMSMAQKGLLNIASLALAFLSLPFSNASVERIFSQMNVVHWKLRNCFSVQNVEALIEIKYELKLHAQTCVNVEPTHDIPINFSAKDLTAH